jgi:hypothetical protein
MWRQWRKSVWASPVKSIYSIYYLFFKVFDFLRLHVFIMLIILKICLKITYSIYKYHFKKLD